MQVANISLAGAFAICKLSRMAEASLNSKLISLGVNKGYASQIVNGKRAPGVSLALRIFRELGIKLGPITDASRAEIAALERIERRNPRPKTRAT